VVTITFRQPEEADLCIAAVNRRYFAGQILDASNWDGHTKYLVKETQEEMEKRLNQWHSFLEEDSKHAAEKKEAEKLEAAREAADGEKDRSKEDTEKLAEEKEGLQEMETGRTESVVEKNDGEICVENTGSNDAATTTESQDKPNVDAVIAANTDTKVAEEKVAETVNNDELMLVD